MYSLPDEIDRVASIYVDVALSSLRALVAVDIGCAQSIGRDETVILVERIPSGSDRA